MADISITAVPSQLQLQAGSSNPNNTDLSYSPISQVPSRQNSVFTLGTQFEHVGITAPHTPTLPHSLGGFVVPPLFASGSLAGPSGSSFSSPSMDSPLGTGARNLQQQQQQQPQQHQQQPAPSQSDIFSSLPPHLFNEGRRFSLDERMTSAGSNSFNTAASAAVSAAAAAAAAANAGMHRSTSVSFANGPNSKPFGDSNGQMQSPAQLQEAASAAGFAGQASQSQLHSPTQQQGLGGATGRHWPWGSTALHGRHASVSAAPVSASTSKAQASPGFFPVTAASAAAAAAAAATVQQADPSLTASISSPSGLAGPSNQPSAGGMLPVQPLHPYAQARNSFAAFPSQAPFSQLNGLYNPNSAMPPFFGGAGAGTTGGAMDDLSVPPRYRSMSSSAASGRSAHPFSWYPGAPGGSGAPGAPIDAATALAFSTRSSFDTTATGSDYTSTAGHGPPGMFHPPGPHQHQHQHQQSHVPLPGQAGGAAPAHLLFPFGTGPGGPGTLPPGHTITSTGVMRGPGSSGAGTTRRAKFKRSRNGCMVCRKRKVKCSQDGTPCKQCRIGKRDCYYESNPPKRKRRARNASSSGGAGNASGNGVGEGGEDDDDEDGDEDEDGQDNSTSQDQSSSFMNGFLNGHLADPLSASTSSTSFGHMNGNGLSDYQGGVELSSFHHPDARRASMYSLDGSSPHSAAGPHSGYPSLNTDVQFTMPFSSVTDPSSNGTTAPGSSNLVSPGTWTNASPFTSLGMSPTDALANAAHVHTSGIAPHMASSASSSAGSIAHGSSFSQHTTPQIAPSAPVGLGMGMGHHPNHHHHHQQQQQQQQIPQQLALALTNNSVSPESMIAQLTPNSASGGGANALLQGHLGGSASGGESWSGGSVGGLSPPQHAPFFQQQQQVQQQPQAQQ